MSSDLLNARLGDGLGALGVHLDLSESGLLHELRLLRRDLSGELLLRHLAVELLLRRSLAVELLLRRSLAVELLLRRGLAVELLLWRGLAEVLLPCELLLALEERDACLAEACLLLVLDEEDEAAAADDGVEDEADRTHEVAERLVYVLELAYAHIDVVARVKCSDGPDNPARDNGSRIYGHVLARLLAHDAIDNDPDGEDGCPNEKTPLYCIVPTKVVFQIYLMQNSTEDDHYHC